MKEELTECPYCGSSEGFYRLGRISGTYQYNYNFDGSHGDNTELHNGIKYSENKTAYCIDCNKKLPKLVTKSLIR